MFGYWADLRIQGKSLRYSFCGLTTFFSTPRPSCVRSLILELSEAYYLFYSWPEVARTVANHFVWTAYSSTAVPCVCGAA